MNKKKELTKSNIIEELQELHGGLRKKNCVLRHPSECEIINRIKKRFGADKVIFTR